MKLKKFFKIVFSGVLFPFYVIAQNIAVSGTVRDQNHEAISGVSVIIKGTNQGTMTDAEGHFKLSAAPNSQLVFSFIGYESQEVAARPQTNVILQEKSQLMDELVVTALGMKKEKKALAYSVTELKSSEFKVKESNFIAGLEGRVAGVNISKPTTGAMGSTRIIIRGNGSF